MVSERGLIATNKERIENLEVGLGSLQEGMHRMELGVTDKLHQFEETINRLSEALHSFNTSYNNATNTNRENHARNHRDDIRDQTEDRRLVCSSKMARLEFPRYSGDDPTEWFNRVNQFFEFQTIPDVQKVPLASFHLEGEANQW